MDYVYEHTCDEAGREQPLDAPTPGDPQPLENPPWLTSVLLYDKAFALAGAGVTGQALVEALTLFNGTLDPPADEEQLRLVIEAGHRTAQGALAPTLDLALASKDIKALYACIGELAHLKAMAPLTYLLKKDEIKQAFGKAVNLNDLERTINDLRRKAAKDEQGEKMDVAEVAQCWAATHRQDWAYDGKLRLWRHWNGQYWEELEPRSQALELEAVGALHDAEIDVNSNGGLDCFQRVAAAELTTIFTPGHGKINFENGTLDLSTMTIRTFQREDFLTYCLSYWYAPGKHPVINTFLKEAIPDVHARQAYMAHLGLALLGDTSMHYVLLLLGPTRSGKSSLLALSNAVCGTSSADNFTEDFSFAGPSLFSRELEGKRSRHKWGSRRIVAADEIPAEALKDEELFKTMSAHGGVEKRGMHKDETTSNQWKPKLILAANDRPRYKDVAGAVKERSIFISCPNHRIREQRDPQLFGKMRKEIGAFAASCLLLAQRVLARGYYPMSYAMKHMLDVIAREGNHIKAFMGECCIIGDATDWSVSETIYAAYTSYCANNGYKSPLPKNVLSSTICNMGTGVEAKRGRNEGGKVVCGLQGLRLRQEQDPWLTDEDELARYRDDTLLVDQSEMLTVVNGMLLVVPKTINTANKPGEPGQKGLLTVLMAQTENNSHKDIPLIDETLNKQGQGGSLEKNESIEQPSTLSTEVIEAHSEPSKHVDVIIEQPATCQHTTAYICGVRDCGAPAVIHGSDDREEEERTYGLWCAAHQDCCENMVLGEMLEPAYQRLQISICSWICEGREAWLHFHQHPRASVGSVSKAVLKAIEEQAEQQETA